MGLAHIEVSWWPAVLWPTVYTEDLLVNSWSDAFRSDGLSWFLLEMAGRSLRVPVAVRPVFSRGVGPSQMVGEMS